MIFDLTDTKAPGGFEILPPGDYNVAILKAEVKDSKVGGKYVIMKFRVMDGVKAGYLFDEFYSIENPNNPKSVEFSKARMKSLLEAGKAKSFKIYSITEFEGLKMSAKIKHRKDQENRDKVSIASVSSLPESAANAKEDFLDDIPF